MGRDGIEMTATGQIGARLVAEMEANQQRLGEIDGAIGDGDHGVNMAKGFRLAGSRMGDRSLDLAQSFEIIGETLLSDIGGSMGPLYGTFFKEMAATIAAEPVLTPALFSTMLSAGTEAVIDLGGASPGDKSLVDVLVPARQAFDSARNQGHGFAQSLSAMETAADQGLESTRGMVARIGRAARLGERSRGHLDAGAASSAIILSTLGSELRRLAN